MQYLDGLNERQREAVLSTEGPLSVLAGAGSGKTRVLTTRIYHLIRNGTPAERILAVTFTNKAAREMRERLGVLLGDAPVPFVATFHGLGRELLQQYGRVMGIPRYFSVYDRDDSERAIKEALKAMDIDPKEIPARSILFRISKAKGEGMTAEAFSAKHGAEGFRSRITSQVWLTYDATLKKEKALDFDDLIAKPVELLERYPEARALAQQRFGYVHVDEYQDTNELQGRLIRILAEHHRNVFVVGDIDQCLVGGTQVTLADGSKKNIEAIKAGDRVLSNYGSGDMRSAQVTKTTRREFTGTLIRISTESGRILTSTPEHIHFAGYKLGIVPQKYFTYLMHKRGVGWRLGVSQTYTNGQRKPMIGFQQRCNQEHGDEVWIVGVYDSSQEARVNEYKLSLSYGIPTLPFIARKGSSGGYVYDQKVLNEIFTSIDTESAATALLKAGGFSRDYPHHRAQATGSDRRNIMVALCGDRRGASPMHRISMSGSDIEGKDLLEEAGFSVRRSKLSLRNWRFETVYKNYSAVEAVITKLVALFPDAQVVKSARLGGKKKNPKDGNSLPFLPASSVLPGMVMFDEVSGYDIVKSVDSVRTEGIEVYDLNIENTHNFIANGLSTHNCIYTWRGATIENLLTFEETYPDAKTIVLEHNYRSTKTIVAAANGIIEKNRNRKEKTSVTSNPDGSPIRLMVANTAEEEARKIAHEARNFIRQGTEPEEIAVLYRTNFQSRALEEAFLAQGVPYRLLGTRFLDRKEVKDVIAWVRLALDPVRQSDRVRAVQAPPRGIGKVTVAKMAAGNLAGLSPAVRAKVEAFESVVDTLHEESKTAAPSAFVRRVIQLSGLEETLTKGGEDDQERLENAKELATLASRYDATPGTEGIDAFLADTALAGDQDELDRPQTDEKSKKGVTLMTVHAAKGLEFEVVFVSGLEEGLFPHEGMGQDEARDEEEERRLFYVAMTRAKHHLILTMARVRRIYGTDFLAEPSSFLHDIDAGLMRVQYGETDDEQVIHI